MSFSAEYFIANFNSQLLPFTLTNVHANIKSKLAHLISTTKKEINHQPDSKASSSFYILDGLL